MLGQNYSPTDVLGCWFYRYLILDIYSCKIVGWEVHENDDADHAARVVQPAALAEGIAANQTKPVLRGDNAPHLKRPPFWRGSNGSESNPRTGGRPNLATEACD